jgi:hypothetical protein
MGFIMALPDPELNMALTPLKSLALAAALLAAIPAAAEWKQLKRDNVAMLSVDPASVARDKDVVSLRYMVDFRKAQGGVGEPQYRSIVVSVKIRCKAKTIAMGHTDAYFAWGAAGDIVAKTAPQRGEPRFLPLEKGSSDQELWTYACDQPVNLGVPPARPPAPK